MHTTEVTNAQFEAFVAATGYRTTAEQPADWEVLRQQLPPGTPKPADSLLVPAALMFAPPAQVASLYRCRSVMALAAPGKLAPAARPGQFAARPRPLPRGAGIVGRCPGLRPLGR